MSYISPCKDEREAWAPTENGVWRMSVLLPLRESMTARESKCEKAAGREVCNTNRKEVGI